MFFLMFLVSYWLNVLHFPVSKSNGKSSIKNRKTASVSLSAFLKQQGEIHLCWFDEIAALPTFLLHLKQLPQPWESGKWK
jgi:hypothetical protein